ncbi:30S ribosomal protein S9, partial [Patescibacteria group bacterium]|nr:30S ribosomal protein S9 [Patescibacteria group bacterium]
DKEKLEMIYNGVDLKLFKPALYEAKVKERKKFGLKKARKAPQWSKR